MKKITPFIFITLLSFFTNAQNTYVPDDNFEQALIDLGYDSGALDDYVPTANINTLTGLDVSSKNISDLTGISDFVALTYMAAYSNQLTTIDVSDNTLLTYLSIHSNQITNLDISSNTLLKNLLIYNNQISNLDLSSNTELEFLFATGNPLGTVDVSTNTALTYLNLGSCGMTSIDVSNNILLESLYLQFNQLTSLSITNNTSLKNLNTRQNTLTNLDISNNPALIHLNCQNNNLTTLDLTNNINLETLKCGSNSLTSLNISQNTSLVTLWCFYNSINSLDLSSNPLLSTVFCEGNVLESLNVKNGNNTNIIGGNFNSSINPNLACIEVDDETWSTTNWTLIDAASSFSEDCSTTCIVNIPDANFKAYLIAHTGINTNNDSEIQCDEAAAFNYSIDCSSQSINDLTGIEAFTTLAELTCNNNALSSLNLTQNTNLTSLTASSNNLTSIDITNNSLLTFLHVDENNLTTIDITNNTALTSISIRDNNISNFDISNNTLLHTISIEGNLLTSFDVSALSNLTYLNAKSNNLTTLNVKNGNNTNFTGYWSTGNSNLSCVGVDDSAWSTSNWANVDSFTSFSEDCAVLGVEEFNDTLFKLYPNPSIGTINISYKKAIDEIIIYDLQGRKVKYITPNKKTVQITTSALQKGIYLIHLKSENAVNKQQIIIN